MGKITKGRNERLFAGEWIFSECEDMAYKLDKEGRLIFNSSGNISDEKKLIFTMEALTHLGVDPSKAQTIAETMETF